MEWDIVIGLEVHVQLQTESKLFCGCANRFTHEPNSQVCPVCLGLPGVLPVLNEQAFELALRTALALNCRIAPLTKFDRKHYYYPDLPKNIQISQYDMPFSNDGHLDIVVDGAERRIGITRVHIEEDAGKLIHHTGHSAVDLNRTGTPLCEIVSEPDLRSPAEARAYLELLKRTLLYAEVSDCSMEEGSLRCDANISIRPAGETRLGVKNEIKNMNSFRGAEAALALVAERLIRMAEAGETIHQVTWGYSVEENRIFVMREKEEANDYRYFPEPDLPPVRVTEEWIDRVRSLLPELPREKEARLAAEYSLSDYDAGLLAQDRALGDYFEAVVRAGAEPKEAANWILNDLARLMNERGLAVRALPLEPGGLAELIALSAEGTVNTPTARKLLERLVGGETGSPRAIVEAEGLGQVTDTGPLREALEAAITGNPKAVSDIENGKPQTAMFFVGQIMRATGGQADPQVVAEVIADRFGIDPALLQKKKKDKKKKQDS